MTAQLQLLKQLETLPDEAKQRVIAQISNTINEQAPKILKKAYEQNILTQEEYKTYENLFIDDYGIDSFIQYLDAKLNTDVDIFYTLNPRMLIRKEELEAKFQLKILQV